MPECNFSVTNVARVTKRFSGRIRYGEAVKLALLTVAALAFCACGDRSSTGSEPAPSATATVDEPTATAVPTLANTSGGATPSAGVIDLVRADLARQIAVAPGDVSVVSVQPMTWPDGCLGLARPGQACTQALVPGWLAVLRGPDGTEYRYRGAGNRFEREP